MFYGGTTIFYSYVNNGIFLDELVDKINHAVCELADVSNIEDKGDVNEYLGVKTAQLEGGKIKLYQPYLIQQIFTDLHFNLNSKSRPTSVYAYATLF